MSLKIARALFGAARALAQLAELVAEDALWRRSMTDAMTDLENAETDRETADSAMKQAVADALNRVTTDTQHLIDEINAGAGNTDPGRLSRVAERIKAGTEQVRQLTQTVAAEDPDPSFPAPTDPTTPTTPAPTDPTTPAVPANGANDGGVPATDAPTTPVSDGQGSQLLTPAGTDENGVITPAV